MDAYGNGLLVEKEKLPVAMKLHPDKFSMDKFRHMCILSGCDYLASLPGIGLVKACKFIKRTGESNMTKALSKLGAHLNMPNLIVTPDYKEKFAIADSMFKHQPVFDPLTKTLVPLTPLPPGQKLPFDEELPPEVCYQLALGNLEPFTLTKMDDWDPSQPQNYKTTSWNGVVNKSKSIWSDSYVVPNPLPSKPDPRAVARPSTLGKIVNQSVKTLTNRINSSVNVQEEPKSQDPESELDRLREQFGVSPPQKKQCLSSSQQSNEENLEPEESDDLTHDSMLQLLSELDSEPASPPRTPRNPFSASHSHSGKTPENIVPKLVKIRKTVVDDGRVVQSRFFTSTQSHSSQDVDDVESVLNGQTRENSSAPEKTDLELRLTSPEKPSPKSLLDFHLPDTPCSGLAKLDLISKMLNDSPTPSPSSMLSPNPFKKQPDKPSKMTDFLKPTKEEANDIKLLPPTKASPKPPEKSKYMLKSPKHVGLKRKKSISRPGPGQPSIFEMFAFQPKAKISTKPSS